MKFLVVEDDAISRLILKKTLEKQGYKIILAENGKKGWEIFQKEKENIYLIIVDWIMPEMDGLKLCKKIRASNLNHYVYIIFLSAKGEKKDIITGLEAGADDYLTKPFEPLELLSRIKVGLRIIALEQRLKEINQKLQFLAITDGLTGILNRRAILERLKEEIHRAKRENYTLAIIMADIDHFKKINDEYGHLIGDKILIEIAKRLKSHLRPYDHLGRYGGEEFLIIISKIDKEKAIKASERLRKCICENVFKIDNQRLNISISLGVTCIKSSLDIKMENLIEKSIKTADNALYKAKEKGRNCVVYEELIQ